MNRTNWLALTAAAALLALPATAHAYIDPNTGGFFFQLLFPFVSMLIALAAMPRRALSLLWHKLRSLAGRRPK
jgi:hypothetical protein